MKHLACLLTLICAIPAVAHAAEDPLAPARQGLVQCYEPDQAKHTCRGVASYEFKPDGRIESPALVLLANQPPIIMAIKAEVTEKDGAICGVAKASEIDQAKLLIDGKPASAAQDQDIKAKLKTMRAPRLDKEICTSYMAQGDVLIGQSTLDGQPQPDLAEKVIWVKPEDGYSVAP